MPFFDPPRRLSTVHVDLDGKPSMVYWKDLRQPARVVNSWLVQQDWHRQGAEIDRTYYRLLLTRISVVIVIFRDNCEDRPTWYLESVLD